MVKCAAKIPGNEVCIRKPQSAVSQTVGWNFSCSRSSLASANTNHETHALRNISNLGIRLKPNWLTGHSLTPHQIQEPAKRASLTCSLLAYLSTAIPAAVESKFVRYDANT